MKSTMMALVLAALAGVGFVSVATLAWAQQPERVHWEYRVLATDEMREDGDVDGYVHNLQRNLTAYGRQGWEVVTHGEDVIVFKRPR